MADILTWASDLDNAPNDISTSLLMSKSMLFQIFMMLKGAGWTVVGSCAPDDAGANWTAGMDGVDRLGDVWSPLRWVAAAPGTNHTWFVLYHATLGHSICVDLNSVNAAYPAIFVVAKTAFVATANPLLTYRPASVDEWLMTTTSHTLHDGVLVTNRIHMIYATRGDFLIWTSKSGTILNNTCLGLFKLEDLDPVVGDNYPVVSYSVWSASTALLTSTLTNATAWRGRTGGGYLSGLKGDTLDNFAYWPVGGGQWRKTFPSIPIVIWVDDNGRNWGDYKGILPDITHGPLQANGAPMDSPVTRRIVGNMWLPGMPIAGPTYG